MSVIVDTNLLVRLVLLDDTVQIARVTALSGKAARQGDPLVVVDAVLMETLWVLSTLGVPRERAAEGVAAILETPGFAAMDEAVALHALELYGASSLDPVDALLVARSKLHAEDVASFDSAVNAACGRRAVF